MIWNMYDTFVQRIIVKAIFEYLLVDPNIETRKRKQLRQNAFAPWELRLGKYRIFYKIIEDQMVKILAIGHKEHNDLYIQGKKVEI